MPSAAPSTSSQAHSGTRTRSMAWSTASHLPWLRADRDRVARGHADAFFVTRQRDPVDAQVAVHERSTGERLVVPLQHQTGDGLDRAEVTADGDVDPGML